MMADAVKASAHVYIIAGEESGDRLGAALIGALRQATDGHIRISGLGGAQMAALGVNSAFPLGDLAIIGFAAIPARLWKILKRIAEAAAAVIAANPDVLVIVDSPDFTHRIARRVRRQAPHIPIIDYVCPSVWAWRPGRAKAMRGYIDHVLALLPFEPATLRRLGGPPATYVGHPLTEQIGKLRPNAAEALRRRADPPLVLALPGSRTGEVRRLAATFGAALERLRDRFGPLEVVVPAVPHLAGEVRQAAAAWSVPARVVTEPADKHAAFRQARAALTKSGTSTLELALAGVPMVAAYKVSMVEEAVARALIKVSTVILANLVLGEEIVPQFLQRDCTAERLAAALFPLLTDGPERARQTAAFGRLDAIMGVGEGVPSARAAGVVLSYLPKRGQVAQELVALARPSA